MLIFVIKFPIEHLLRIMLTLHTPGISEIPYNFIEKLAIGQTPQTYVNLLHDNKLYSRTFLDYLPRTLLHEI